MTRVERLDGTPSGDNVALAFFRLAGQEFMAINGGPQFPFTEAVSFSVSCTDQAEVDRLWSALTADGGEESMCGWLKDRFGLSWQIIPERMGELLSDPDPERSQRAMQAMLKMQKIDVQALETPRTASSRSPTGGTCQGGTCQALALSHRPITLPSGSLK